MPFPWEIEAARMNMTLIAILLPPTSHVTSQWAFSWGYMEKPPHDIMDLHGLPWGEARTEAANRVLANPGYQWLFFLDSDVLAPRETILRLQSHRLPIVSGLYNQRFPTWLPDRMEAQYLPCMFREARKPDGTIGKDVITDYKPGSLVEADYVPGGCLLIHRMVFERMKAAGINRLFEWTLHADSNPPGSGRCVPPGEEVFGGSPIETVERGEQVLDKSGLRSEVTSIFSRPYSGELVKITPEVLKLPFRVTPEHHVLVLKRPVCRLNPNVICRTRKNCCAEPVWKENKAEFIPAGELKTGMYLAFPKIAGHNVRKQLDLVAELKEVTPHQIGDKLHFHGCHTALPASLPVTPELLQLLGLYVAEGWASAKHGIISLSFGPEEHELVEKACRCFETAFGIKPWVSKGDHALCVNVKRKPLAYLLLSWFGREAREKRIPRWILDLPASQAAHFLRGLWDGDGCQGYTSVNKRHSYWMNTSSKSLALGVVAMLLKYNIHCGIFKHHAEKAFNHGAPMYRVTIYGGAPKFGRLVGYPKTARHERRVDTNRGFFWDKKFWFPVGSVESEQYHGIVHDLSANPRNSFVLGPAIVHNSEDFEFCNRARSVGFRCVVDTAVTCAHETGAVVRDARLLPKL